MCDTIWTPEGEEIDSLHKLLKRWPEPVYDYEPGPGEEDQCICPVDIKATAEKYGEKVEYDPFGMPEWEIQTSTAP